MSAGFRTGCVAGRRRLLGAYYGLAFVTSLTFTLPGGLGLAMMSGSLHSIVSAQLHGHGDALQSAAVN